jgi:hypothetical protein
VNDKLSKLEIIEGATEPVQGWVALYSGEKLSAPVLRYRRQVAAPTTFCTLLYPRSPTAPSGSVKATQSPVTAKAAISDLTRLGASLTALTIDTGDHLDCLLIAPGTSGVGKVFGNHETDAELLYMRQQKANGDPITLEMHNGTWLGYQSRSLSAYANNLRKSEVLRV